jgi:hypothetical protein
MPYLRPVRIPAPHSKNPPDICVKTIHEAVIRLRAEYLDMPGLRLKPEQVQRLCGLERIVCQSVLDALVVGNFLRVTIDGEYVRLFDGPNMSRVRKRAR